MLSTIGRMTWAFGVLALIGCGGGSSGDGSGGSAGGAGAGSGGAGGAAGGGGAAGMAGSAGSAGMAPVVGMRDPNCDPIGEHCSLPMPNDYFLLDDPDGASPTGKSVQFGPETLPRVMGTTPIDPSLVSDLDGWSVISSPTVYMPGATATGLVDPTNLAASVRLDSATILLNTATGELVPHFAEVDQSTPDLEKALMLRPMVVLDYATRYVVAIRGVVDSDGAVLPPTAAFAALRDGASSTDPAVEARRADLEEVFSTLGAAGIERDDLQIAWDFTTGSRESITGPMVRVRDAALAVVGTDGPTFTVTSVEDDPNQWIKHRVILTATLPQYLSNPDFAPFTMDEVPRIEFDDSGEPIQNGTMEMEVLVQIPNSVDSGTPHGILQNGHGFFGSKDEGRNGFLARTADGWSWIHVAVDLFGFAEADLDLAAEALLGRPELLTGFVDRQIQGHVNQLLAMRMMIGRVAANGIQDSTGRMLLTPAQVDPSVRAYRGDSQGGIMGGTYMSISTDVTRGLLGEPAVGYSLIWQRSADSSDFTDFIAPTYPDSALDFQILLQLIQMRWDRSEPSGFVRSMTGDTLLGTPDHHVLLHAAIGDHQVPTMLAHAMARSIDAQLVRSTDAAAPYPRDVYGLDQADAPVTGASGLVEYDFGIAPEPILNEPPTAGCDPHDRVRELTPSFEQQDVFLRTGRIEWFCDGFCSCDDVSGAGDEGRCVESFQQECQ